MSGLPPCAVRLAVVRTADGAGHLVLVIMAMDGNLVLDSLTDEIAPCQLTEYQWLKLQSVDDPRFWIEVKSRQPNQT
jgi:predicted transglutaminase-like cysteine proteinase